MYGGYKRYGSRALDLKLIFSLEHADFIIFFLIFPTRYTNRVKAETERMNQLELDDLEVVYFHILLQHIMLRNFLRKN